MDSFKRLYLFTRDLIFYIVQHLLFKKLKQRPKEPTSRSDIANRYQVISARIKLAFPFQIFDYVSITIEPVSGSPVVIHVHPELAVATVLATHTS